MSSDLRVVKLGENIGARIDGVRLGDVDAETARAINEAMLEHKVIFFRGQHHLDDEAQFAFARCMGVPTSPHPTLKFDGERVMRLDSEEGGRANQWHTDVTFVDRIPKASILRAVELPPYGGTTTWASTVAAYRQLPAALQELADKLWAMHNNQFDYAQVDPAKVAELLAKSGSGSKYVREFGATHFEAQHPVVRVHPETGEKALLLGNFVKRILDVSGSESQALFRMFQDRITWLENTIRWSWELGDVAMWDNRATQHYAISDYGDQRRRMHRVTLAGDVPVSVDGESSRVIAGDASDYSVIDNPKRLVA
ncbi:TauD/TfdA dioxygenase family protein [Mycobacteroides immunogenum]|uniref:Alpha-ketoglutarate-dependent sulfate ester dioxygenase n=1 Tax=Mycobacteroides immunogenum TaxID=83262 RepID=A0A7V8LPL1_9MYCO|nr:TauD/TfdA family dioxygenase [Mycobacteroides immunogenum]AMT69108.1 dioxygenase [Mycobacteroides immunogenum]ANO02129.1 taurine catabolism dioxygenase [Mycobacteroides immunogenum]KIU40706.1 dioxygenase [Mycobacteroides immunogenum]KPG11380.1 dioxygenase [Mycobacteroides immunogenum]KPG12404.1 dioxygenase [Mycobacteroides immunogenum]